MQSAIPLLHLRFYFCITGNYRHSVSVAELLEWWLSMTMKIIAGAAQNNKYWTVVLLQNSKWWTMNLNQFTLKSVSWNLSSLSVGGLSGWRASVSVCAYICVFMWLSLCTCLYVGQTDLDILWGTQMCRATVEHSVHSGHCFPHQLFTENGLRPRSFTLKTLMLVCLFFW